MTALSAAAPAAETRLPRHRLDELVRAASGALFAAALLLVTYWWVADGGLRAPIASADALIELGRWTGLVASVLLLAQVVLMARIPLLERAYGQDVLARKHRVVGFTGFSLMMAHVVLTTWGYAAGRILATPGELWRLTVDYPGMLLATVGTGALVLVVATSIRAARRRLRYESWHLLHLYAYLGVGLALPHQLWTGEQFIGSPARTAFWWSAWAATAGAVIACRLVLPVVRSLRHDLRVTSVAREADGVVSVYLTGRDLQRLPVEAGQFLTWRFLAGPGWTRAHPYSLSAAPDGRSLRITVKALGDGGRALSRLRPGTRALFEGPYGRLSPRARSRRTVALLGAGVGVTPLRALAEGLDYRPGEVVLVQRYVEQPLFARELDQLAAERGLEVRLVPGHRTDPGCAPAELRHLVPDLAEREVYVCGPDGWAEEVRRTALDAGVPPERLHVESFRW